VTRRGGGARSVKGLAVLVVALASLHGALIAGADSLAVLALLITLAGATIAPTATSIYALTDRAAPRGTATEAFSWLVTASTSGAAVGAAVAGALVQSAGPCAAFAFGAAAGAGAVLIVLVRSRTLEPAPLRPAVEPV
jgi:predicted MFS family arabinose efflux permease